MTDFERGAEAMRGLCVALTGSVHHVLFTRASIADAIRALPLPVQPPGSESREARLADAVESMAGALRDAAALIESARVLAVHNGNAASERAFEAGRAAADAAVPMDLLIDVLARARPPPSPEKQRGDKK